jgi:hypothetical protein
MEYVVLILLVILVYQIICLCLNIIKMFRLKQEINEIEYMVKELKKLQ